MINFEDVKEENMPIVVIGIFVEKATPFLQEFFEKITFLKYPKKRIHIYLHNNVSYINLTLNC